MDSNASLLWNASFRYSSADFSTICEEQSSHFLPDKAKSIGCILSLDISVDNNLSEGKVW